MNLPSLPITLLLRSHTRCKPIGILRKVCSGLSSSPSHQERYLSSNGKPRNDPTAKRPNKLCDPYGQGGKPLTLAEAEATKTTLSEDWEFEFLDDEEEVVHMEHQPIAIRREFIHPDFLTGARFIHKIAAVAQVNAHYPSLTLDRRIVNKNWQVMTVCRCDTFVLGGLSTHDFYLAMVRNFCLVSDMRILWQDISCGNLPNFESFFLFNSFSK